MNGFKLAIYLIYVLNVVAAVLLIGKRRDPITPGYVVVNMAISAGVCTLVHFA